MARKSTTSSTARNAAASGSSKNLQSSAKERVKEALRERAKRNRQAGAARARKGKALSDAERHARIADAVWLTLRKQYGSNGLVPIGDVESFADSIRARLYADACPIDVCNRTIRRYLGREGLIDDKTATNCIELEDDNVPSDQPFWQFEAAWDQYCRYHEIGMGDLDYLKQEFESFCRRVKDIA